MSCTSSTSQVLLKSTNSISSVIPQKTETKIPNLKELALKTLEGMSFESLTNLKKVPAPITYLELPNGVTIVFQHVKKENSDEAFASLRLVVKAGHNCEIGDETGYAHFREHAAFLGTENFNQKRIQEILRSLGSQLGSDANAFTSPDSTAYKLDRVPTNGQLLKDAVEMLSEFAHKLTFPHDLVEKEFKIVDEELLRSDGVTRKALKWLTKKVYNDQETLEHWPEKLSSKREGMVEKLKSFDTKWYRPHNMCFIAVGNFGTRDNQSQILQFINDIFSKISTAEEMGVEKSVYNPNSSSFPTETHLGFMDTEYTRNLINIMQQLPNENASASSMDPKLACQRNYGYESALLIRSLVGGILQMNFKKSITDPNSSIAQMSFLKDTTFTQRQTRYQAIFLELRDNKRAPLAYQTALIELKKLVSFGAKFFVFEAAKAKAIQASLIDQKKLGQWKPEEYANDYQNNFLDAIPPEDLAIRNIICTLLSKKIFLEHLQPWINSWNIFSSNPLKFLTYARLQQNDSTVIELEKQLESVYSQVLASPVEKDAEVDINLNWLPSSFPAQDIVDQVTLDTVDKRHNFGIPIEILRFKNGLNVILAPTLDKEEKVNIRLFFPYGSAMCQDSVEVLKLTVAVFAFSFLPIKHIPNDQIRMSLERFLLRPFSGETMARGIEFKLDLSDNQNLEMALKVLYAQLNSVQEVTSDEFKSAYQRIVDHFKEYTRKSINTSQGKFENELKKSLAAGHPALLPEALEDFDHLTPEDCFEVLKNAIGDISGANLLICGNFDKDRVKESVQKYAGHLAGTVSRKIHPIKPYQFIPHTAVHPIGDVPDRSTISIVYGVRSWGKGKEELLHAYASNILQKYLLDKIRWEGQQTYSVTCSLGMNETYLGEGLIRIRLTSKTDNIESLRDNVISMVNDLSKASLGEINQYLKLCHMERIKKRDENKNRTFYWTDSIKHKMVHFGVDDLSTLSKIYEWESEMKPEDFQSIFAEVCNLAGKAKLELTMHPKSKSND